MENTHCIEIKTSSYNQRRYSKPWIALVDFKKTPSGEYKWGDWVGDHRIGSEGILVIMANVNDIIAVGQKDFRQPKNSAPNYYYIDSIGNYMALDSKADAYKHYQSTHN